MEPLQQTSHVYVGRCQGSDRAPEGGDTPKAGDERYEFSGRVCKVGEAAEEPRQEHGAV